MHYNENAGRPQTENKKGTREFAITFSKYKKEGYIVRKVLTDWIYNYVDQLFDLLLLRLQSKDIPQQQAIQLPVLLCAIFGKPYKDVAIAEHTSRFK